MQHIERLQVTNHERWGKLVKTWATGTNYLEDDNVYPLPDHDRTSSRSSSPRHRYSRPCRIAYKRSRS